jgi:hypothetical protein
MENKITTEFEKFKDRKEKEYSKDQEFDQLSDDISVLRKLDNGEYEKIKGPIHVRQVTGIILDEKEIDKIENVIERVSAPVFNTDLQLKKIKRGDIIWVTALLDKPNATTSWNSQTMGVLKCRIVDYYYGLNKLKNINQ